MTDTTNDDLAWILNDVLAVPHVLHALVLSADGLLQARSAGISKDEADRQAAALSGLQSISSRTAAFCDSPRSPWRQSLVEFEDGYVLIVAAGSGAFLAVSSTEKVDLEALTYQTHKLVDRLGKSLISPPREGADSAE
jgi:predicted regulator of Ras-like GTPase activity (Roadblock/LC7/MglB family)